MTTDETQKDSGPTKRVKLTSEAELPAFGQRVCPKCKLPVIGGIDVCPRDGTKIDADLEEEAPVAPRKLSDRYDHIGSIGSGGMSIVYKARDRNLDRVVAIKQLSSAVSSGHMVLRFQREACAYAALKHPNIVNVYDFGFDEENRPFLVMDFLEGKTLGEVIAESGSLSIPQTLDIFIQILDGLSHAHTKDIVHRDLKPENIMIQKLAAPDRLQVKIMDFGIAKVKVDDTEAAWQTQTGYVMGSPLYMSPEQSISSDVDARADIYSIGCMLFEALTGQPPFRGENLMGTIVMHRTAQPPRISDVAGTAKTSQNNCWNDLEAIVFTAIAKNPEDRYQGAADLRSALVCVRENWDKSQNKGLGAGVFALPKMLVGVVLTLIIIGLAMCFVLGSNREEPVAPIVSIRPVQQKTSAEYSNKSVRDSWESLYSKDSLILPIDATLASLPKDAVKTLSLGEDKEANRNLIGIGNFKNLKRLNLCNMKINAADISEVAKLDNIDLLCFNDCTLPEGVLKPLTNISCLTKIEFRGGQIAKDNLTVLPRIRGLQWMTIEAVPNISDRQTLEPVGKLKALIRLCCLQMPMDDESVKALTPLSKLEVLLLDMTKLTDNGCKEIAKLKNLRTFSYAVGDGVVSDAGLKDLCTLPLLRNLDIRDSKISDAGLMMLAKVKDLEVLNVAGCKDITEPGIARFKALRPKVRVQTEQTVLDIKEVLPTDDELERP